MTTLADNGPSCPAAATSAVNIVAYYFLVVDNIKERKEEEEGLSTVDLSTFRVVVVVVTITIKAECQTDSPKLSIKIGDRRVKRGEREDEDITGRQ